MNKESRCMNDQIKINLQMAGFTYPVIIDRKDEEAVRKAAKQINQRFYEEQKRYSDLPPERVMTLVAYQFALETLQLKQRHDTEPYTSKIKELTSLLDNYFNRLQAT